MVTNRNSIACRAAQVVVAAWLLCVCGCAPPGPRALLQGKKLIEQGRLPEAVGELERAVAMLPKTALAWNYLGLAYHGNRQPEQALKAYRTALALDHKLSAVRYNLGCLYLEQTNLPAAVDELRSYTLLQPGAVEGWLRLATAQLRARRPDEAERSFRTAAELHPRDPEALNGLGLVQMQRRRWQEALNQFNAASTQDPPYPPALLNSAIVAQQYLGNRPLALQRYRLYLALRPRPADWDTVEATVRALDHEARPAPAAARIPATPAPAPASGGSPAAPAVAAAPSTPARRTNPPPATARSGPMAQAAGTGARTNAGPAPAVSPRPAAPAVTNLALASSKPAAETPRPTTRVLPTSVSAPAPAPPKAENPIPKPPEVEIAQVQPDLIVKPPQDLTRTGTALGTNASSLAGRSEPGAAARGATNQTKRGLLARLNPFSGKPAQGEQTDAVPPVDGVRAGPGEASRPPVVADIDPARPVPRYNYLAPLAPTAGSNVEAEKEFKKAFRSAKAGNRPQAIAEYQAAVRIDPAYYDAYYNLGLAALENSDVRLSLWAYEIALALKPDAEDARYNFALALKSGGYWLDAVEELKRLLGANPDEARAHLSLANLYSQQLGQPHVARFHYERVLELNPRHPEAVRIRYWLAANQ